MNRLIGVLLFVLIQFLGTAVRADAPNVRHLFPSAAQRGSSCEIEIIGTLSEWPVDVWTSDPGLEVRCAKTKGRLTVQVAGDAALGQQWIRLHNASGASALRPFLIHKLRDRRELEPNNRYREATKFAVSRLAIHGRLSASADVDTFSIPVIAGETVVAKVDAHGAFGSPMDAVLQLLSPKGFVIAQNHDARSLDPQLVYQVTEGGNYLLRIFAFPSAPNSTIGFASGDEYIYRLLTTTGPWLDHTWPLTAASPEKIDEHKLVGWNLAGSTQFSQLDNSPEVRHSSYATVLETEASKDVKVDLPSSISARIETAGDSDAWVFAAKKAQRVSLVLRSRRAGFPLDAVLELFDPSGKKVKELDDSIESDPELHYTIAADGDHRVVVRDRFAHGGPRYVYQLDIAPSEPTFTLQVAADRHTVRAGESTKIAVYVKRLHGHGETVDVSALNLPKGLEAKAVPSEAKDKKSSKQVAIEIKASPDAPTFSGPLTIRGTSKNGEQDATITTPTLGRRTEHLWITVLAAPAKKPTDKPAAK